MTRQTTRDEEMKELKRGLAYDRFNTHHTLEEDVEGEEDNESSNKDNLNESDTLSASEIT